MSMQAEFAGVQGWLRHDWLHGRMLAYPLLQPVTDALCGLCSPCQPAWAPGAAAGYVGGLGGAETGAICGLHSPRLGLPRCKADQVHPAEPRQPLASHPAAQGLALREPTT